jgi:hypothetical protein
MCTCQDTLVFVCNKVNKVIQLGGCIVDITDGSYLRSTPLRLHVLEPDYIRNSGNIKVIT